MIKSYIRLLKNWSGTYLIQLSATWNLNNQSQIAYGTDQGNLHIFDVRMPEKLIASQKVHKGSVNDVKIGHKNMIYTCS